MTINKAVVSNWEVLVVEDEKDNREIAFRVLTFHGAKVHEAEHGAAGMALLDDINPTFILLDLSMPVMDGWEMLKQLKANPKTAAIPVIALTAHALVGDRERVIEAGFDGYISKPFSPITFLADLTKELPEAIKV